MVNWLNLIKLLFTWDCKVLCSLNCPSTTDSPITIYLMHETSWDLLVIPTIDFSTLQTLWSFDDFLILNLKKNFKQTTNKWNIYFIETFVPSSAWSLISDLYILWYLFIFYFTLISHLFVVSYWKFHILRYCAQPLTPMSHVLIHRRIFK